MTTSTGTSSLLTERDLGRDGFLAMVARAAQLKRERGRPQPQDLAGRTLALVFEKASTRTRCAFEVAAAERGARTVYLGPEGSHIGREESIPDTARVLGRLFDGITFRGFGQDTLEQLDRWAGIPVWNALTDAWHPTQMLADVLTMTEHHAGPVERIALCYLGDGRNNVARSLLVTGAMLGMDVRIATPAPLRPPPDVVALAHGLAAGSGARVLLTEDVDRAVRHTDFVYTDVWVSMGESDEQWADRIPMLRPYRVTPGLMVATGRPDTKFMHCLPSLHGTDTELGRRLHERFGLDGIEVDSAVFEGPANIAFDQAENRMHTIKALLTSALAPTA